MVPAVMLRASARRAFANAFASNSFGNVSDRRRGSRGPRDGPRGRKLTNRVLSDIGRRLLEKHAQMMFGNIAEPFVHPC
jgi:hypothetical protein